MEINPEVKRRDINNEIREAYQNLGQRVSLRGFSFEEADQFLKTARVVLSEGGYKPKSEKQEPYQHEIDHIRKARDLGANLQLCNLSLSFLRSSTGQVEPAIELSIMDKTIEEDPWKNIEITLAPEWISPGDAIRFLQIVQQNRGIVLRNPSKFIKTFREFLKKDGNGLKFDVFKTLSTNDIVLANKK